MHKTNWDDLRIALAVIDAGSVNAAAQKLKINHATVLRRLGAFEARHSISLFQKSPSGYRVDPASKEIVDRIRNIDKSVDAFERAVARQDGQLNGTVRVTSTDSLCWSVLPEIINDLHRMNDDLSISMVSTNAHLNLAKLDADITVRPAKELPADLIGNRICEMTFRPYGAPDHLKLPPSSRNWLGVTDHLLRSPVGAWIDENVRDQVVMTADSFVSLTGMAATGLGVAILPCCLGDQEPRLRRVGTPNATLTTGTWVATHQDVANVPRVKAVMKHISDALSVRSPLLEGH